MDTRRILLRLKRLLLALAVASLAVPGTSVADAGAAGSGIRPDNSAGPVRESAQHSMVFPVAGDGPRLPMSRRHGAFLAPT